MKVQSMWRLLLQPIWWLMLRLDSKTRTLRGWVAWLCLAVSYILRWLVMVMLASTVSLGPHINEGAFLVKGEIYRHKRTDQYIMANGFYTCCGLKVLMRVHHCDSKDS